MYRLGMEGGGCSGGCGSGGGEPVERAHVPVYLVLPVKRMPEIVPQGFEEVRVTVNGVECDLVAIAPVIDTYP